MLHYFKRTLGSFTPAEQTFDMFYNKFSRYISKYKTLSSGLNRSSRIGAFNTQVGIEHERGRGRGRGRGCGKVICRGCGRGRGRGQGHNPCSISRSYSDGTTISESKIYDKDQYQELSQDQHNSIQELKSAAGWINLYTSPNGYVLDGKW